jgi:hypothetical protein
MGLRACVMVLRPARLFMPTPRHQHECTHHARASPFRQRCNSLGHNTVRVLSKNIFALEAIVLATSRWDKVDEDEGIDSEQQLKTNLQMW